MILNCFDIVLMKLLYAYIVDNMSALLNPFSSMLNSLYNYVYGAYTIPAPCPQGQGQGQRTSSGNLVRQGSTANNVSYRKYLDYHHDYTYGTDSCQTIYLAEKKGGEYTVTILFTRDDMPKWIKHTLDLIMIRILLIEKNTHVLEICQDWAIIGSIDCQPDRNKDQIAYHQDNVLTNFVPNGVTFTDTDTDTDGSPVHLRTILDSFFRTMFPQSNEMFDPESRDCNNFTTGFQVESPTTAHIGILDYLSSIPIVAAAARDQENYTFTELPPSTDSHRAYLFYFNSIITHSTPERINIELIKEWYKNNNKPEGTEPVIFYNGFQSYNDLIHAIEKYNSLFEVMKINPRNFRRLLAKIIIINTQEKSNAIDALKRTFQINATNVYDFNIPQGRNTTTPPPEKNIHDDDDDDATIIKKRKSNEGKNNTNIYSYAYKIYLSDEIDTFKNTFTAQLEPSSFNISRNVVDVTGGKSKRNKSKRRRNTKKKYHLKKRRQTQRKQNKKRRSRKR